MGKLSTDLTSARTLHPRENLWVRAALAAVNAEIIADCDGGSTAMVRLTGAFVGTFVLEGLSDDGTWDLIPVRNVQGGAWALSMTVVGAYVGSCAMYRKMRLRNTAYTSGSANAFLQSSIAALDNSTQGLITPLVVTATAAAGAALTLTLPAPGAGLRQYLTYLRLVKFAAAALTAGATPVIATTTNLPGSLAFSLPADAALQGSVFPYQEDFSYPIMASAQNTAVTIVMPLTTNVLWRATAGYYLAP